MDIRLEAVRVYKCTYPGVQNENPRYCFNRNSLMKLEEDMKPWSRRSLAECS